MGRLFAAASFFPTALLSLAIACHSPAARAEQELIVSAGRGLGDALIQKDSISGAKVVGISYSGMFHDYRGGFGRWQWWVQGSYSRLWLDHRGEDQHQNVFEVKPVLRWYPNEEGRGPFGEAGVGAAYLTNRDFGEIRLPTKPNFALHFAAGYRLRNGFVLSLRYSHFSNGYTNRSNPGFDFASLNGHFNF